MQGLHSKSEQTGSEEPGWYSSCEFFSPMKNKRRKKMKNKTEWENVSKPVFPRVLFHKAFISWSVHIIL